MSKVKTLSTEGVADAQSAIENSKTNYAGGKRFFKRLGTCIKGVLGPLLFAGGIAASSTLGNGFDPTHEGTTKEKVVDWASAIASVSGLVYGAKKLADATVEEEKKKSNKTITFEDAVRKMGRGK